MKTLSVPGTEEFYAFEIPISLCPDITEVVASSKTYDEVMQFQEFLKANGRSGESIIMLSGALAITENINGPILWTVDKIPYEPNFNGLEVKELFRSYAELEYVIGHTEEWKAVEAAITINKKLEEYEIYNLTFSEYCESVESTKNQKKSRRL